MQDMPTYVSSPHQNGGASPPKLPRSMSANFAAEHDPDIEVTHVKLADGSPASVFRTKVWDTWPLTRTAIVLVSGSTMLFLTGPLLGATAWYALPRWLAAPLLLGYAAWVATSKSHKDGSVVDTAYRTSTVHLATLEYFKARLVMEDSLELRESRPLVIGQHPHGVYGYHGIFFMASSKKNFFYRKFPHLANKICLAVADVLFYVPFVREILLYVGHVVVSRSTLEKMLAMGRSVGIVIGGEQECLLAENGTDKVVLGGRKGFVKLALRYGADLVPSYCFHNNDAFHVSKAFPGIRGWLKKNLHVSIPIYWGRWGTPFPRKVPICLAIGRPIHTPLPATPGANVPDELVDQYHELYVAELQALFERCKEVAGYPPDRCLEAPTPKPMESFF